jgi:hypothetical protein
MTTTQKPVLTADEVFAANKKLRWAALASNRGEVLLSEMRPGVKSYSPPRFDREFVSLGPLTTLGVCERYSEYLKGVDYVVVYYQLAVCIYARLDGQVLAVSIERDQQAVANFLQWLESKRREIIAGQQ